MRTLEERRIIPRVNERIEIIAHLVPGEIVSENDGDIHFIGAKQLAELYHLRDGQWEMCSFDQKNCSKRLILHLWPRSDGKYEEVAKKLFDSKRKR